MNNEIIVANMIAQQGIYPVDGIPPIRYRELGKCLGSVHYQAFNNNLSIHMPRIGAGLACGDWNMIEDCIKESCPSVPIYVYTLPSEIHKFK